MISMKNTGAVLLMALLFAAGIASAQPQSPQQPGDRTKTDSNVTKNANAPGRSAPVSKSATAQKLTPPARNAVTVW